MNKAINYIRESFIELTERVTWPPWSELIESASIVLAASAIFAFVVSIVDFLLEKLLSILYTI